jgi:Icc-related predicted phosphoesterase
VKIVCISDTHLAHTKHHIEVPDGDVLIHAGDATFNGTHVEVAAFSDWFASHPHRHKLFVPGNHDRGFEIAEGLMRRYLDPGITYLRDSGVEIDGLKFWGSPWQPEFCSWAFNLPRGKRLAEKWAMIPDNTDVLITHGPPMGVLDRVWMDGHVGCKDLMNRVLQVKPALHVFGHIHVGYGIKKVGDTIFANAATCNQDYRPINAPLVIEADFSRALSL